MASAQSAPSTSSPTGFVKPRRPELFTGDDPSVDPANWCECFKLYCDAARLGLEDRIIHLRLSLGGSAGSWWRMLAQQHGEDALRTMSLDVVLQALQQQFQALTMDEQARDKLVHLEQRRSVATYNAAFRALLLKTVNISPADALDMYKRGLKKQVAFGLALVKPTDLLSAMATAERLDAQLWRRRSGAVDMFFPQQQQQQQPNPVPMELGAMRQHQHQQHQQQQYHPAVQQQRRPFHGLCYACGTRGHMARNCPAARRPVQYPVKGRERRRD